ncbi:MAG: dTDP-glucose 4,6-dehydratase [Chloroflexi bacterium]|nr:dTDP-glucose 4,6-dehydratase [Chloroflexota bacterium]
MLNVLVTGGAGFIGSNFVRSLLQGSPDVRVVVYDKLTYAGNLENLSDVAADFAGRYAFVQGDICDAAAVGAAFMEHAIQQVVNFAAETHVDRSLLAAGSFVTTDVYGTYVLLEQARLAGIERFLQVGTDEVYGEVMEGSSLETDVIVPRSPYSASKAGADLMVLAYRNSFGMNTLITRGSNTFGPYQYPEKFIPLFVTNAIEGLPLPLYGDGRQVRDWIHVLDHCAGIATVLRKGEPGEVYNVGGGNERENIVVAEQILRDTGRTADLLRTVADRPGHDRRYSIDTTKLRGLGWAPLATFEESLTATVRWYIDHPEWWRPIKSGEYRAYYDEQYGRRLSGAALG